MQKVLFVYFLSINSIAFVYYTYDKYSAISKKRRISEKKLHLLSLAGGFLGATLSMALFRHKVSKASFLLKHILIIMLWIVWLLLYFTQINELNFLDQPLW